jgi:hypothetical protein
VLLLTVDEPQQNIIPPNTTTKTPLLEKQNRENDTLKHHRKHVNHITIDHVLLLQNDNSDLNELTKCKTNHAILQ